jgi:Arc/MetJ-type ribon-helix-helix transcriptional regulator
MQVVIPDEVETFVKNQASLAGYHNVSEYVMSLIQQDHEARKLLDDFAADERVETLALEGLDSGPAIPLDMQAIRQEFRSRVENQSP